MDGVCDSRRLLSRLPDEESCCATHVFGRRCRQSFNEQLPAVHGVDRITNTSATAVQIQHEALLNTGTRSVKFPDLYCYLIEMPGDFTGEKLKTHNFGISGWVKPLQVLKRKVTTAMTQPPDPVFFPPLCTSPFLTRVWKYHHGKIVELKMYVGTF